MRKIAIFVGTLLAGMTRLSAQAPSALSPVVREFVKVDAPVFALSHVRVIDGLGARPLEDQTVVVRDGRIEALGSAANTPSAHGSRIVDLAGATVIPGLVGMQDHLFYPSGGAAEPRLYNTLGFGAPRRCDHDPHDRKYRTLHRAQPEKSDRRRGVVNPKIHISGPYLEGAGAFTPQMHELTGPDDARKMVDFWAEQGATSFKVQMHITRAELAAAVEAAHKRGAKVTDISVRLGSARQRLSASMALEHGLMADTEFLPEKSPDVCPSTRDNYDTLAKLDLRSTPVREMIRDLVRAYSTPCCPRSESAI